MSVWSRLSNRFAAEVRDVAHCGHRVPDGGEGRIFGEEVALPRGEDGRFHQCFECIEAASIHCAWCGFAIPFGSAITIAYKQGPQGQGPHEEAVPYDDAYIGCLRESCSYGFDMGGNWIEDEQHPGQGRVMHIRERLEREALK